MNNLVSIITPMHNAEQTIEATIQSVQQQTYTDWEMLIIDDASTDYSRDAVERIMQTDYRIRLIANQANSGVSKTRNRGIQEAQGRYIAFLDSDDLWAPEKLERQLAYMEQQGAVMSYTACNVIDEHGNPTGKERHVPPQVDYQTLLRGNPMPCLTIIIDTTKILKEEIHMPQIPHEDYALWLTLLREGRTAVGLDEVLGSYRVQNNSVSGNKWRAMKWQWNVYRKQEHLSAIKSAFCMVSYILQALAKRV